MEGVVVFERSIVDLTHHLLLRGDSATIEHSNEVRFIAIASRSTIFGIECAPSRPDAQRWKRVKVLNLLCIAVCLIPVLQCSTNVVATSVPVTYAG